MSCSEAISSSSGGVTDVLRDCGKAMVSGFGSCHQSPSEETGSTCDRPKQNEVEGRHVVEPVRSHRENQGHEPDGIIGIQHRHTSYYPYLISHRYSTTCVIKSRCTHATARFITHEPKEDQPIRPGFFPHKPSNAATRLSSEGLVKPTIIPRLSIAPFTYSSPQARGKQSLSSLQE